MASTSARGIRVGDQVPHRLERALQVHRPRVRVLREHGDAGEVAALRPTEPEQHRRQKRHDSAHSMREVDGHPCRMVQDPTLVRLAKAAPQHEGILEIRLGPPLGLALREIGTGHRGVVGAGPAAEQDLHRQYQQPQQRKPTRDAHAGRHRRLAGARMPQREPQPPQHADRAGEEVVTSGSASSFRQQHHRLLSFTQRRQILGT